MADRLSLVEFKELFLIHAAIAVKADLESRVPIEDVLARIEGTFNRSWAEKVAIDLRENGYLFESNEIGDNSIGITVRGLTRAEEDLGKYAIDIADEIEAEDRGLEASIGDQPKASSTITLISSGPVPMNDRPTNAAGRIAEQPLALADMALSLSRLVEEELERRQHSKPNDPGQLVAFEEYNRFLVRLLAGLGRLEQAIRDAERADQSQPVAHRFAKAAAVASEVSTSVAHWLRENKKSIVHGAGSVALIGAGTAFLTLCGAPAAAATGISAVLFGGKDTVEAVKAVWKEE